MSYPTTDFTKTPLPSEYAASPVASQPLADIEGQYNETVRSIKELWACIQGAATGNDINGTALTDYSTDTNLGILPRLVAIELNGKIQNSAYVQVGTNLGAGNRGLRFTLGSTNLYGELYYDNDNAGIFKFRSQNGGLSRVQAATPTLSDDLTTKRYVDGLLGGGVLKKFANIAAPLKATSNTLTVAYAYCANSDGTVFMAKDTSTTINVNTTGVNGIANSLTSRGINGTISVTSGSAAITGSGTSFLSDFIPGDWFVTQGGQVRLILSISSDTAMTTTTTFSSSESNVTYSRGGVKASGISELNLYMVSDAIGQNPAFMLSTRNVQLGDTLVDFPKATRTGTISFNSGSKQINGSGTLFLSEFVAGQNCVAQSGSTVYLFTVDSITSNTSMTATLNFGATVAGASVALLLDKYRQLPYVVPIDNSGNIQDHIVDGFPLKTSISFPAYDGTSFYTLVASYATAANASYNLWTNKRISKLSRRVRVRAQCTLVADSAAPSQFNVGPTTSNVTAYQVWPIRLLWNSFASLTTGIGQKEFNCDLDTSGNIWYKSQTTNASGDIAMLGYDFTEWRA